MRQSIIGFISGVAALLFLVGCRENPVRARLAEIESFAASSPDSARRALEAIDHSFLNTRRLQAQHALMLSTALSRCKVKVPSDSLINIAVNYYGTVGPRKDAFLSYYYQGRVYQDLEDYESAMRSYLVAESIHSKKISLRYLTSLQIQKGDIYWKAFSYEGAVNAYIKAQHYAALCGWTGNLHVAKLRELGQHIIFSDYNKADSLIQELSSCREQMSLSRQQELEQYRIHFLIGTKATKDSILLCVRDYESRYKSTPDFPWGVLAFFYNSIGSFEEAERCLTLYADEIDNVYEDRSFLKNYSVMQDSLGNISEAESSRKAFYNLQTQELYRQAINDTRFLERNALKDRRIIAEKRRNRIIVFFSVLLTVFLLVLLYRRRTQKKEIERLYVSLKEEQDNLTRILDENRDIQDAAKSLLGERISAIGQFLLMERPSSLDKVSGQLESLTENRKELLETIGLLYAVYHPAFVNRLQSSGLTNGEIGYCCLLLLGFRTGEIGDVINRSSTYHISSVIRQKVGLGPNDTNLAIFLKHLFRETGA